MHSGQPSLGPQCRPSSPHRFRRSSGRHQTHPAARHHSRPTYTTALTLAPRHTLSHTQHTHSSAPRQQRQQHRRPPPQPSMTHPHPTHPLTATPWTANPTPRLSHHHHHGPPRPASPALPPARRPLPPPPPPRSAPSYLFDRPVAVGSPPPEEATSPSSSTSTSSSSSPGSCTHQYHLCPPAAECELEVAYMDSLTSEMTPEQKQEVGRRSLTSPMTTTTQV